MKARCVEIENLEEFRKTAHEICSDFKDRSVILLEGPLASGKTEFVKAMVNFFFRKEALKRATSSEQPFDKDFKDFSVEETCSPSFSIINSYALGGFTIDHVDLYRLKNDDDLETTGFWDLFQKEKGFVVVEWAQRLDQNFLPRDWKKIKIAVDITGESTRKLSLEEV